MIISLESIFTDSNGGRMQMVISYIRRSYD
jgi:hypothetical protein